MRLDPREADQAPHTGDDRAAGPGTGSWSLGRTERGMTYGVMLPHFGRNASPERLLQGARLVERLGFDAVWVRDHLLWKPHVHESPTDGRGPAAKGDTHAQRDTHAHADAHAHAGGHAQVGATDSPLDRTFVEPIVTLSAIATITQRVQLGTAVLIPLRTPAKTAHELASLSYLSGGRVVAGIGAGHDRHELEAAGMDSERRREIVEETPEIMRLLWSQDGVTYRGRVYSLDEAILRPRPLAPIPLLYGGPSRLAVRIAARHYDGWMPGVLPFTSLDGRLALLHELTADSGRRPSLVVVPRTSIDLDRAAARKRAKVDGMIADGIHHWEPRPYSTIEDLRGALLTGEPDEIVEQVLEFDARGFDHFVIDIRWQFDRFEEGLELIAERVLPQLRGGSGGDAASEHAGSAMTEEAATGAVARRT